VSAPEVLACQPLDPRAVDIWSLGLILHVMVSGTQLYQHPSDPAFIWLAAGRAGDLLLQQNYLHGAALSPLLRDLIAAMLCPDPARRITVEGIRAHEWVSTPPPPPGPSHTPPRCSLAWEEQPPGARAPADPVGRLTGRKRCRKSKRA
jgi:serine/threonine protein kinase